MSTLRIVCLLCLFAGYLVGNIQWAYIIGKVKGIDIKEHGSGNAGATNVFRVLGWGWGILVFVLDFLKVFFVCFIAHIVVINTLGLSIDPIAITLYAGFGAVLGHNFTFYLKFKGGKGVAASCAVICCFGDLKYVIIGIIVFMLVLIISGYVSLASMVLMVTIVAEFFLFTLLNLTFVDPNWITDCNIILILMAALLIFQHRQNIVRLVYGEENKFSISGKKTDEDDANEDEEDEEDDVYEENEENEKYQDESAILVDLEKNDPIKAYQNKLREEFYQDSVETVSEDIEAVSEETDAVEAVSEEKTEEQDIVDAVSEEKTEEQDIIVDAVSEEITEIQDSVEEEPEDNSEIAVQEPSEEITNEIHQAEETVDNGEAVIEEKLPNEPVTDDNPAIEEDASEELSLDNNLSETEDVAEESLTNEESSSEEEQVVSEISSPVEEQEFELIADASLIVVLEPKKENGIITYVKEKGIDQKALKAKESVIIVSQKSWKKITSSTSKAVESTKQFKDRIKNKDSVKKIKLVSSKKISSVKNSSVLLAKKMWAPVHDALDRSSNSEEKDE